jgi:hypothetical protein
MAKGKAPRLQLGQKGACEMRRQHSHRPLRAPHQPPAFTYQTRDALAAILEADVGVILSEDLYSDGIGLERLLAELGGTRRTAIGIIAELIKKTTADGAAPGSIGSWSYFTRPAKMEMRKLQAA